MNLKPVDHSAIKVNQVFVIGLTLLAFILNQPVLVALVAAVMLTGSLLLKKPGFSFVYSAWLKTAGLVKPDVVEDNPEPHLFAQGFGGVVLTGSVLAVMIGAPILGWGLAWLVIALASLNLFAGFCAGCAVYYWLNRLNIPGFAKAAPAGIFPGLRPRRRQS
jgi:hypothetical protein